MKKTLPAYLFVCYLILASLFFSPAPSYGQTHQWVRGGGSFLEAPSGFPREMVWETTTDDQGNIYVLAETMALGSLTVDTMTLPLRTNINNIYNGKVALLSFNCNGRIRWGKILEGTQDFRFAAMVYNKGNIYISGMAFGSGSSVRYFGPDTMITGSYYGGWLIRYDTAGSFKWARSFGENTIASFAAASNWYCKLVVQDTLIHCVKSIFGSGVQLSPTVVSRRGIYDFTYTPQGDLLSVVKLPLADSMLVVSLSLPTTLHAPSNTLYLSVLKESGYEGSGVAVFDASRNLVRYDTFATTGINYGGAASTFRSGNDLYTFGTCFGSSYTYKGHTFSYPFGSVGRFGFVMKTDLNNNLIWKRDLASAARTDGGLTAWHAGLADGKILMTGAAKSIVINGDTLILPGVTGKIPIVIMDTTGQVQKMDFWHNSNAVGVGIETGTAISSYNNSIYVGGMLTDSLWGGNSGYQSKGGKGDFFIAKYGYACNCDLAAPAFTRTTPTSSGLVQFTYTGTANSPDSVRWQFGDGSSSTLLNPSHTYAPGTYNVCLTTYNSCGDSTRCQSVQVTGVGIGYANGPTNIKIYPNPATQLLVAENVVPGMLLHIYDITGKNLQHIQISQSNEYINISHLAPGSYVLRLMNSNQPLSWRFVKE